MKQVIFYISMLFSLLGFTQQEEVHWITFPELEEALKTNPKKVMVHFYADWCEFCTKMEKDVYTKPEIISELNTNYYAIKFDVETKDSVAFGGKVFKNLNFENSRRSYHQIAEILARKDAGPVTVPAVVFLNEEFMIQNRLFRYISPGELIQLLQN